MTEYGKKCNEIGKASLKWAINKLASKGFESYEIAGLLDIPESVVRRLIND